VPGKTKPSLRVSIPPDPAFARSAREEVISFATRHAADPEDIEEFIFAVGEALTNAIEHSLSEAAIEVRCEVEGHRITAMVVDCGAGFHTDPLPKAALPDILSERGRGLPIMRRCSDVFAVHSVPGKGTAVVLGRYLQRREAAS